MNYLYVTLLPSPRQPATTSHPVTCYPVAPSHCHHVASPVTCSHCHRHHTRITTTGTATVPSYRHNVTATATSSPCHLSHRRLATATRHNPTLPPRHAATVPSHPSIIYHPGSGTLLALTPHLRHCHPATTSACYTVSPSPVPCHPRVIVRYLSHPHVTRVRHLVTRHPVTLLTVNSSPRPHLYQLKIA